MAKPDLNPRPDTGTAERPRLRTLAAARARQQDRPPGEKMKQDGGVKRRLDLAAVDAKGSLIGEYDSVFVESVRSRWFALLEDKRYDGYQRGKVVVQFALNSDGRITDLVVQESTVDFSMSLVCEMAVLDPAPYAPWPSDMRRMISGNKRVVTFTFFYN
jgi:hypothetical protein